MVAGDGRCARLRCRLRGGLQQRLDFVALLLVAFLKLLEHVRRIERQQPHPARGKLQLVLPGRDGRLNRAEIGIDPQRLDPLFVLVVLLGPFDGVFDQLIDARLVAEFLLVVGQQIGAGGGVDGVVGMVVA